VIRISQSCGECRFNVRTDFERCEDCSMILCINCQYNKSGQKYCSACYYDKK